MDEIIASLTNLFGPAFLVLCVVVYVLVELQRRILELFFSKFMPSMLKEGKWQNKLWSDILLPSGAPGTGMLFTWLIDSYPYPDLFTGSVSNRIVWGIFAGFFSGYVYRIVKQVFKGYLIQLSEKFKKSTNSEKKSSKKEDSE